MVSNESPKRVDPLPQSPIGPQQCVLPDMLHTPELAPLPAYRRFPRDPLPRRMP